MKKSIFVVAVAVVMAASIGGTIMYSCQKDQEPVKSKSAISEQKSLQFEDIDKISSEMADFHTFTMKKFLAEIYSENDVLDNKSV
jgi:predicted RNase H-related nuclease YkuK (DUF458 family)